MLRFLSDGGVFAYLVLLVGLGGVLVCLAHLVLATRRTSRDVEGLVFAAIGVTLALGLMGLGLNLTETFRAVSAAAPAQKQALTFKATAISLYPLILSMGLAAVQVILTSLARAIRATRGLRAVAR